MNQTLAPPIPRQQITPEQIALIQKALETQNNPTLEEILPRIESAANDDKNKIPGYVGFVALENEIDTEFENLEAAHKLLIGAAAKKAAGDGIKTEILKKGLSYLNSALQRAQMGDSNGYRTFFYDGLDELYRIDKDIYKDARKIALSVENKEDAYDFLRKSNLIKELNKDDDLDLSSKETNAQVIQGLTYKSILKQIKKLYSQIPAIVKANSFESSYAANMK